VDYLVLKWLHVVSSTFLFGTGVGSAFYLLFASLSRDARVCAWVARYVVIADWLFTATTVVVQPLTGMWLVHLAHFRLGAPWLKWSIVLYAAGVACWLPVIRLQLQMRNLAVRAAAAQAPLPPEYFTALRRWVGLGIPAFFAFLGVFYLMTVKPS
jgi:uncharacterized membrane protein